MVDYQIDISHANKDRKYRAACVLAAMLLLAGCSHWQAIAARDQLQNRVMDGAGFRHRLLWNSAAEAQLTNTHRTPAIWHILIEGDGHAVTLTGQPARDPTPPAPLLLPALAVDAQPALYLGRPCYFDTQDPACTPIHWTLERYSTATVASMATAANRLLQPNDRVILIGHSGGGTLAMLLAAQLPQTCAVITLAGNLNVGAWVAANDYTPLPDSLDPTTQPPLAPAITQWHFAGEQDTVILPAWIETFGLSQPGAHVVRLPATDHIIPWGKHLVESLKALQNPLQTAPPPPLTPALDNSRSVCGKVTG